MPDVIYKLTKPDLTTYNDYQWVVGEWRETDGKGGLCGPGWLHAYTNPLLAEFMNPIHANWTKYRLWQGEGTGARLDDRGLKVGYTKMRIIAELPLQTPTREQRIRFGIWCAASVYQEASWRLWAERWITGHDRTIAMAKQVYTEAYAAYDAASAASAAAAYAVYAAVYSADAAASAAAYATELNLALGAHWAMSTDTTLPTPRRD